MTIDATVASFLRTLSSDPIGSFADVFLVGDRTGVRPIDIETFLRALPGRADLFARAGIGTPELDELAVTVLDEHYLVARTEWTAPRSDGAAARLVSTYVLFRKDQRLRVVAYLNHRGPSS